MMIRNLLFMTLVFVTAALPQWAMSVEVTDYLILEDIGPYQLHRQSRAFPDRKLRPITPYKTYMGSAGIVGATGHFSYNHEDVTYKTGYESAALAMGVEVEISLHTGGDSDQWLLHEVERGFRSEDLEPKFDGQVKEIVGSKIFTWQFGTDYRWISNNIVVMISYTDSNLSKPEPLEIVQAYLQKFPSTIPTTLVLDRAHDEQWIKEEMDRRLWLGDKWFTHQAANNTDISETLREVNRSLEVFLNYREKYFGVSIGNEKEALYQLVSTQNLQGMKDKLTEYKSWWSSNKSGSINLP